MTQEREAFEAWALGPSEPLLPTEKYINGEYKETATADAWETWQAVRASLAQPAIAPAEPDVGHSALAGMILTHLGYSTSPSLEPCADERRDRLAEKLAGWLSASPQAPQPAQAVPMKGTLNLNDPSVQKRLAAQWGYVQAPAPGDALLPMIERLEDAASAALTQAHNSGKVVHKAGVYMPAIETGAELARAIVALRDFASKGAEPHVWLYDFIDGETTVRNWSTTNKAEAFAPGNFNQRGYVPAEN